MSGQPTSQYEKARQIALVLGQGGAELTFGSVPVSAIAERVGTPFFAYGGDALVARLRRVKAVLGTETELFFSLKANPSLGICQLVAREGIGAELASIGELSLARRAGFSPQKAIFAGPGKTDRELQEAVAWGIESVNVESRGELERLAGFARAANKVARASLRVNPKNQVTGAQMRMGGGHTQFGIDEELVPEVVAAVRGNPHVAIVGIHVYAGSQIFDVEALLAHCHLVVDMAAAVAEQTGSPIQTVDFGGGFAVPYFADSRDFELDAFAKGFRALVAAARKKRGLAAFRPIIELGRYLVAECGVYVAKVIDVKQSRGVTYAVVDGGMNHHITATGNFGQVFRKPYPVAILNRMTEACATPFAVVGPCCTPLDVLGAKIDLPALRAGDLVGVFHSGAYGYSASSLMFLSHPTPAEVLVLRDEVFVLREPGAPDQVLVGQRGIP